MGEAGLQMGVGAETMRGGEAGVLLYLVAAVSAGMAVGAMARLKMAGWRGAAAMASEACWRWMAVMAVVVAEAWLVRWERKAGDAAPRGRS